MNLQFQRKIETNKWLIKSRWLYTLGIFLIGLLTKVISYSNVYFSVASMVWLVLIMVFFNAGYWLIIRHVENNKSEIGLKYLGYMQLGVEIILFTIVMHMAGGVESIALVFFFLPIVAASLIVGTSGAVLVAFISGILVNGVVISEYFGILAHIPRYGVTTIEFIDLYIGLTKSVTVSIFFIIVAWFSGYGANILIKREQQIEEKTEQMDRQTKMLVRRDIKLSETNSKLLEEKNKVGAIIANFTDPIIFINRHSEISLFNSSAEHVFGLLPVENKKKVSAHNNYSLENFSKIINVDYTFKRIEEHTGELPVEEMSINKNNEERIYKVVTAPVYNQEKSICFGVIKIFYDLTREKMIDRLKSEFISIAAHQLRTPLTSIKWVIKMTLDGDTGPLNDEQRDILTKGYISNERVIRLVNDLLNVSRIEEGRFGYVFNRYDFQDVLNAVVEGLESAVAKGHIDLVVNKPQEIPHIYMDRNKITIALQNLLDNAIKYSPQNGKIEINIELGEKIMRVSVRDHGLGIPKEEQASLFQKFFRASNVKRTETEGSGLGLFIVKNIIEKHGGIITVDSEEGKGTTFSFTIPL